MFYRADIVRKTRNQVPLFSHRFYLHALSEHSKRTEEPNLLDSQRGAGKPEVALSWRLQGFSPASLASPEELAI
jgi:hypothetical protein